MAWIDFSDFGYIVDSCPGNKTEYTTSATKLGCGVDENGRSQYVCVPNHERSTLVEFCYTSATGLFEKGNCLEVYKNRNLDQTSCLHFIHGCPSDHFFLSDLYKFPACQGLNIQERCFFADPACPNTTDTTAGNNQTTLLPEDNSALNWGDHWKSCFHCSVTFYSTSGNSASFVFFLLMLCIYS
ncbi:uncharacterized protein LOC134262172 [Saccostrea cucullata]|uniref:uncharacterized protein LOC134262172 n=1 Tax=Saccostrea cuccullata TaxID=36930 RepID=UPI002ED09AFA